MNTGFYLSIIHQYITKNVFHTFLNETLAYIAEADKMAWLRESLRLM